MALCQDDEAGTSSSNYLSDENESVPVRRKKKSRKKKQRRKKSARSKTRRRKESIGETPHRNCNDAVIKMCAKIVEEEVQKTAENTPPKETPVPPSNGSEMPLSSMESKFSARQNLTSTVDESLSRLKIMNQKKDMNMASSQPSGTETTQVTSIEIIQKVKEQTTIRYTPATQKPIIQSSTSTRQEQSNVEKSDSTTILSQRIEKKSGPAIPDNKSSATPKHAKQGDRALPTTMSLTTPWARKFILSRAKDSLLPIPREFLSDGFNLVQLAPIVEREAMMLRGEENEKAKSMADGSSSNPSLYKAALRLILEEEGRNTNSTASSKYAPFQIQKAAEVLYTMVHARYVTSPRGLDTIRRMFKRNTEVGIEAIFGRCSRINCNGMPLLPLGMSDRYDIGAKGGAGRRAMRYCPSCGEAFFMWESKIDGAAWGTSFAHLFLMAHGSEIFPPASKASKNSAEESHQPTQKIFGFRIHPAADMNGR